jgi:hypothetical protein
VSEVWRATSMPADPGRRTVMPKSASERPIGIAVDVGGTFTDLHTFDARTNQVQGWKIPTTPADPSRGLMQGLREAADRFDFTLADFGLPMHGTTVATNTVLERKLARGLLVTREGFEDVLEIKRHVRRDIYGLQPEPPPTLIPRDRRLGIRERMRADGSVEIPLDERGLPRLLDQIDAHKAETIAICLLHSYVNPAHERRLGELVRAERPALPLSCEVSPEIREFERCSTVVLNALLVPVVKAYLDRLESLLGTDGFEPRVLLVQSNGGVCSLATAAAAIPANAGCYRLITIIHRPGSITDCRAPASVAHRVVVTHRLANVLFGALHQVMPERIPAAYYGGSYVATFQTIGADDHRDVLVEIEIGGPGAGPDRDGANAWSCGMHNNSNIPIEMIESQMPLTIVRYGLAPGSGGDGQHRAGLGLTREWRVDSPICVFTANMDRFVLPPYGLAGGGGAGGLGRLERIRNGEVTPIPPKSDGVMLRKGDSVRLTTSGGGGFGGSAARSPDAMACDRGSATPPAKRAFAQPGRAPSRSAAGQSAFSKPLPRRRVS